MNEYLNIKEFSKEVGLSKQAIYQRLEKDLKPFVKVENRVKYIKTAALELFRVKPVECLVENSLKVESPDNIEENGLVKDCFQYTFQVVKSQIEIKDKQLAEKDTQLAEKDKQLTELMKLLSEMQKPKKGFFSKWFRQGH